MDDGTEVSVVRPLMGTNTTTVSNFIPDADRDTETNPVLADTDGDMLLDGVEDANQNGAFDEG